jgi:ABC-2 type transport system permease protein
VVALFLVTTPIFGILTGLGGPTLRELAGLVSPMFLIDGVAHWLFPKQFEETPFYPGSYGALYAGVAAIVIVGSTLLLLLRYRRAGS